MKIFTFVFLFVLFAQGCATEPTIYQPHGEQGGYSDAKIDEKTMVARFAGNSLISKNEVALFSHFRAIEVCREQGFKLSRVYATRDLSNSQTVQKSSTSTFQDPVYFSGAVNSNTNFNGAVYGGGGLALTTSWQETYTYPIFDTYYRCANEVFTVLVKLKQITIQDMKPFVKDLLAAVQIEEILPDSPNIDVFKVGDLVLKVNEKRIQNIEQFDVAIGEAKDPKKIPLQIVREGVARKIVIVADDKSANIVKAENQIIYNVCAPPEFWNRKTCSSQKSNGSN